jgi:hypothetical protein
MPQRDGLYDLSTTGSTADNVFATTAGAASTNVIDFGAYVAGTASPYLPAFPSRIEGAYNPPAEAVGDGGVILGVHLVIATAPATLNSMTSGTLEALWDNTSTPATVVASRSIAVASLVPNAHFFLPCPQSSSVPGRYLSAFTASVGGNPTTPATGYMWYGPKTGGEL